MKIEMKITFSEEEVQAMCEEKCRAMQPPVPGKFVASVDHGGRVTCRFEEHEEEERVPALRKRAPSAIVPPVCDGEFLEVGEEAPIEIEGPF